MLSKVNYQDLNKAFAKGSLLFSAYKIRNLAFLYHVVKFCLVT